MPRIEVIPELCKSCRFCINVCPRKIIKLSDKTNPRGYRFVEQMTSDMCTGCKMCALVCPDAAIEVYK